MRQRTMNISNGGTQLTELETPLITITWGSFPEDPTEYSSTYLRSYLIAYLLGCLLTYLFTYSLTHSMVQNII